jgi:Smg protein
LDLAGDSTMIKFLLMAVDNKHISIEELKWISLIVLLSQADEELAIAHMEHIIYQESPAFLN